MTKALMSVYILILASICDAIDLEYIHSFVMPTEELFQKTRIGGLSGLFKEDEKFWAISDDKGQFGEPRIYRFGMALSAQEFNVKPEEVISVRDKKGKSFGGGFLDLEGIVAWADHFIVISEGNLNRKPRELPRLMLLNKSGHWVSEIELPGAFKPEVTGRQTKGVRNNGAMEGLSLSPSGNILWVANEQPLVQDQPGWKKGLSGGVPVLRYQRKGQVWVLDSTWIVPLEAATKMDAGAAKILVPGHGFSEILALDDSVALLLERRVEVSSAGVNYVIQIFEVSQAPQSGSATPQIQKKLIFDLGRIKDHILDKRGLDNLEGMSWGPSLNGERTLILVSDDNFSSLQRTLWLAFKVKEKK